MLRLASQLSAFARSRTQRCLRAKVCAFTTSARQVETVRVPVGGTGTVQLDVEYPASKTVEHRTSILIYFPPGPSFFQSAAINASNGAFRSFLSKSLPSTTFITLNYRLSKPSVFKETGGTEAFRFPQPIHDATIAFTHILDDLIPSLFPVPPASSPSWKSDLRPKIALAGSHIGAALATMLALTEPNSIHAVALADPMVDWVILDELLRMDTTPPCTSRGKRSVSATPTENMRAVSLVAERLIDLRTKLFASPSAYFDPFASPTLFLRAPGRDTPRTHVEALGLLDAEGGLTENTDDYEWDVTGRHDSYWNGTEVDNNSVPREPQSDLSQSSPSVERRADSDTLREAVGTDSFGPYDDDHTPSSSPPSNGSLPNSASSARSRLPDTSSLEPELSTRVRQVKRRKVLRRWPPNTSPEKVMLPYFNVFVSAPSSPSTADSPALIHGESGPVHGESDLLHGEGMQVLLRMQGMELVDLLRRACFYGREKGFGEERVRLEEYSLQQCSLERMTEGDRQGQGEMGGQAGMREEGCRVGIGGLGRMGEEGMRSMIDALKRRLEEA